MAEKVRRSQRERVSVVIPLFNGTTYLPIAIESVLAQTQLPDEIVVIDDGSTDGSLELAKKLLKSAKIPTVFLSQTNARQSAARNAAVAVAKGSLICFIDQDDQWHPQHIQKLSVAITENSDIAWVYSDFNHMDAQGRITARNFIENSGEKHPLTSVRHFIEHDAMILPSAVMVRKSFFEKIGGFDTQLIGYEDDDFFIRLFLTGGDSRYLSEPLLNYRTHGAGSSASATFLESRLRYFHKMQDILPHTPGERVIVVKDYLFPRLIYSTRLEYSAAISRKDFAGAQRIAAAVKELYRSHPHPTRRATMNWFFCHPRFARGVVNACEKVGWLQKKLPPGLYVRKPLSQ